MIGLIGITLGITLFVIAGVIFSLWFITFIVAVVTGER